MEEVRQRGQVALLVTHGRFPKFHRVFLGRDPGTLKSDIVSNKHPQFICSDLRLSNWKFEDWYYGNRPCRTCCLFLQVIWRIAARWSVRHPDPRLSYGRPGQLEEAGRSDPTVFDSASLAYKFWPGCPVLDPEAKAFLQRLRTVWRLTHSVTLAGLPSSCRTAHVVCLIFQNLKTLENPWKTNIAGLSLVFWGRFEAEPPTSSRTLRASLRIIAHTSEQDVGGVAHVLSTSSPLEKQGSGK